MQRLKLTIFFVASCTYSFGQALSSTLFKQFDQYRKTVVSEKIYVTTDRQLYLTGELVWFKIYCVDGTLHKPNNVSKVAYVEILNRENKSVLSAKVELVKGEGTGSFFIPTSLSSDNYVMRAYTSWMKNFNPDFYFHKIIGIINPFVRIEKDNNRKPSFKVEFYPEGGTLINAIQTRIGCKVSNSLGEVSDVHGFLIDQKNDTVLHFIPKNNIGSFDFIPEINKKYRVLIKSKEFGNSFHPFPEVRPFGYSMKLTDKGEQVEVGVWKTSETETSDEELTLFAHTRNILVHNESKRFLNKKVTFTLSKKELPSGVSHFTIFNEEGKPVCQRLYFTRSESNRVDLKVDIASSLPRQKNSVRVTNVPKELASLSVSIAKIDSLQPYPFPDFSEHLEFWSDINSNCFENKMDNSDGDDMMLTSLWNRFDWSDIINQKYVLKYLPEPRGHVVRGTITDPGGAPKKGATVFISTPDKKIDLHNSISDGSGGVAFEMNDFYGSHKLVPQTNRLLDSTSSITLINPFSDKFSEIIIPELKINVSDEKKLLARSVRMQTQNIFFEEFENNFYNPMIDSLPFYGKPDETYKLDDYTRFPLMEEVMREYVPGVVVRKRKDGFNFFVLDKKHNSLFRETPLILLDGVPIFDADEIMQFDPLKVKRLEVVTAKYFRGNLEFPGIVSYSTYQGDMAGFQVRSKNGAIDYEGLQTPRKFYSPSYASANSESHLPDPRYLLYWNPSLKVEGDQKAEAEFYTSDVPGTYLVKVEGITTDGKVIQGSTTFVVTDH